MVKSTAIVLFCITIILIGFMLSSKATGIWHLIHLATMPEDLFSPIIHEKFDFDKEGNSKEYTLNPKYRDFYAVSIFSQNGINSSDFGTKDDRYKLKGKFKIELFSHDHKVSEKIVSRWTSALYKDNNMKIYKSITIFTFPVPVNGFSTNRMKLKITVIESSNILKEYKNDIELQIKVSGIP